MLYHLQRKMLSYADAERSTEQKSLASSSQFEMSGVLPLPAAPASPSTGRKGGEVVSGAILGTPGSEVHPFHSSSTDSVPVRRLSGSLRMNTAIPVAPPGTAAAVEPAPSAQLGWGKGEEVMYTSSDGQQEKVRIVNVHREDVEPYYTIMLPSTNRERQTTQAKLSAVPPSSMPSSSAPSGPPTTLSSSDSASASMQLQSELQPRRPQPAENGAENGGRGAEDPLVLSAVEECDDENSEEGAGDQDRQSEQGRLEQSGTMPVVVVERSSSRSTLPETEEGNEHARSGNDLQSVDSHVGNRIAASDRRTNSPECIPGQIQEPLVAEQGQGASSKDRAAAGVQPAARLTIRCAFDGISSAPNDAMFPLLSAPSRLPSQHVQGRSASAGLAARSPQAHTRPGSGGGVRAGARAGIRGGAAPARPGATRPSLASTHPPLVPPPSYRSPRALLGAPSTAANGGIHCDSPTGERLPPTARGQRQLRASADAAEAQGQDENQQRDVFAASPVVKAKDRHQAARSPLTSISNSTASKTSLLRSSSYSPHRPADGASTEASRVPISAIAPQLAGPPFVVDLMNSR
jgi:hypothetical protein